MANRLFLLLTLIALGTQGLLAQGRDPMREIQEIARTIDEQLQEIDRLLLESGRQNQARSRPKELLQQASERGTAVEGGIDRLIEKLTEMKNQSSSGSSSDDQQQQQQPSPSGQGRPQPSPGQPQNRRESGTPDFVQQPQPAGQEPQGQQEPARPQPDGRPEGGQDAADTAENRPGNRQLEPELGPGQAGQGDGTWGELQPYVNFLKNRGSAPKVPEKYRKYWEAYLKQKQGGGR
ncbi:MAG: hypothetical protein KF830_09230 [Planctomycetes bacterium]|nr:hypothetical protein [Planctomycetota bacterium]